MSGPHSPRAPTRFDVRMPYADALALDHVDRRTREAEITLQLFAGVYFDSPSRGGVSPRGDVVRRLEAVARHRFERR